MDVGAEMELKDFVRQALADLMIAVREAAAETNGTPEQGRISPRIAAYKDGTSSLPVIGEDGGGSAFLVEFDLSVVVTDADQTKASGGAKLNIANVFTMGGNGETMAGDARV